jgi:hypothetical protein
LLCSLEALVDYGPIRAAIPISHDFQHIRCPEAAERLGLLVLFAVLSQIKREPEQVHDRVGQGE